MIDFGVFAQIAWTGIAISAYYVLFAVAFSLVLKVAQLWNFAQAGLMGIAFYAMFFAFNTLKWPAWAGFAFGMLVTVLAAVLLEVYGLRVLRERRSTSLMLFIFTLILSEFVAYVLMMVFGTEPMTVVPTILSPVRLVMDVAVSDWDLLALVFVAGALWAWSRDRPVLTGVMVGLGVA